MTQRTPGLTTLYLVGVCFRLSPEVFASRLRDCARAAGIRLVGVVVCNRPDHESSSDDPGIVTIRGSNRYLDFSGYFEGLQALGTAYPESAHASVLFINDSTFNRHAGATILRHVFAHEEVARRLQVPALVGKLDSYRSLIQRNVWSGDIGYITSFCFLGNSLAQAAVRALPGLADAEGARIDIPLGDVRWGHGIPAVMRERIRSHLIYAGSPELWREAATATPELVSKKACCVYFEHRLSGIISSNGGLVPINAGPRASLDIRLNELAARLLRSVRRG